MRARPTKEIRLSSRMHANRNSVYIAFDIVIRSPVLLFLFPSHIHVFTSIISSMTVEHLYVVREKRNAN